MRRPPELRYGVNDRPPRSVLLLSGLQHVGLNSIFLLFPLLLFREAGLAPHKLLDLLSLSMLAMALSTAITGLRLSRVGSGYLCPSTFTAFYLGPSLMAIKAGGLSLLFGMTIFAGLVEAALSRFQHRLRAFFPPEVAGFVVLMLGVSIGTLGVRQTLGIGAPRPAGAGELTVAVLSLGTMIALSVWSRGALRMFSALVGMMVGYLACYFQGSFGEAELARLVAAPLLALPALDHLGWSFELTLAAPFAIGAMAACLKTIGSVTTCQKINDADWVRPDMRSAERGVLADALGSVAAGLCGAPGVNSSTASVGVSSASGVTSRRVAYASAAIFAALAFTPKVAVALAAMPAPVVGATLVFSACFILVNGLQIISSRLLDARRSFVIGLSFMVGLSADLFPDYFAMLPARIQPLTGSSLMLGIVCAVLLNLLFRLGMRRSGRLTVDPLAHDADAIQQFMAGQGAAWGARRDVIERAGFNLTQSVETIIDACEPRGLLEIEASFDEFSLDLRVSYTGLPLELPLQRPSADEILASEEGQRRLTGFLLRRLADRVRATHADGRVMLYFHFDH